MGGSRQGSKRWVESCPVGLVPAPPAAPAATATKSTTAAWSLLAGFVDGQRPAAEFPTVERIDSRIGLCLAPHLYEGEPARTTRVSVGDDLHLVDLAAPLREQGAELRFVRVKRQIANVQPGPHDPQPLSPRGCEASSRRERWSAPRPRVVGPLLPRPFRASRSLRLFDGFSPSQGAAQSLAEAPCRLALLPPTTIPRFLVPGAPLEIPQYAITKDQPLEKADSPFYSALAHGHFQRAMPRCASARERSAIPILSSSEDHAPSQVSFHALRGGPRWKQKSREARVLAA